MSHYTHLSIEEREKSSVILKKKYLKRKSNCGRKSVLKHNQQIRNYVIQTTELFIQVFYL